MRVNKNTGQIISEDKYQAIILSDILEFLSIGDNDEVERILQTIKEQYNKSVDKADFRERLISIYNDYDFEDIEENDIPKQNVIFQEAEIGNHKFAIILDTKTKRAFEAVWDENNEQWNTDFSYQALGVDSFEVAGLLDFKKVEDIGFIICE